MQSGEIGRLLVNVVGIFSVAVDGPKDSITVITLRNHPRTTHTPRRQVRRVGALISMTICASM